MNERDIFLDALEKPTAEMRSEFLKATCGGDSQLRQRVEELLQMHEQTGDFLQVPLVERLADGLANLEDAAKTGCDPSTSRSSSDVLRFLSPSNQPGSLGRLGHYEVREVIGTGGMGTVLRAFDERLHRVVAIKVMAASLAANAAARKRFLREARAAAAVCHDHIVTIHAVEESGDLPYLVMQCVSGLSLQQRIDRDGPLALHEILRIGMQTATGLAAAHAQGLIHRDIKPANILLDNGVERVRITDFGLARAATDASLSQSDIVAGTPQYMAPEQARGESLDCRTDLFSLGSVLYAMCTGRAPFRAANSMAVLKRVCDDAPSPIRDANTDVPEWFVGLIDKLQAKCPDDRYQSATEVAELLGQRLAEMQRSTLLPPLATPKPSPLRPVARRHRAWVAAAAILFAGLLAFGIAEGTGVTQVAATVIRVLTPDGVLIVETDDPDVKVTIEGDGGLLIAGAGLEEIRLRPGNYRVHADKGGKRLPLERELVSISKSGREVVRVKMEMPLGQPAANGEKGAFVLLAAGRARKFDTLAESVLRASDSDTIEIHGNGPFLSGPITIGEQALVIRASAGHRPVIKFDREGTDVADTMLQAGGTLVLEGLELHWIDRQPFQPVSTLIRPAGKLFIANCCFRSYGPNGPHACIGCWIAPCDVRNCLFIDPGFVAISATPERGTAVIDNCIHVGRHQAVNVGSPSHPRYRLRHNTFVAAGHAVHTGHEELLSKEPPVKLVSIEATGNVIDADTMWLFHDLDTNVQALDGESLLPPRCAWTGRENLYHARSQYSTWIGEGGAHWTGPRDLAGWKALWNTPETDSLEGPVRYQGGDLLSRMSSAPTGIVAEDFRLRPDSLGYRSGSDGKDLGADVDLVGPGAAYERWKQTPEYQEWLNETGQKE